MWPYLAAAAAIWALSRSKPKAQSASQPKRTGADLIAEMIKQFGNIAKSYSWRGPSSRVYVVNEWNTNSANASVQPGSLVILAVGGASAAQPQNPDVYELIVVDPERSSATPINEANDDATRQDMMALTQRYLTGAQ